MRHVQSTALSAVVLFVLGNFSACSSDEPKKDEVDLGPGVISGGNPDDPDFGANVDDANTLGNGCVGQTAGTEAIPAVLQLVVDTSGSMDDDAPGSRDSKWEITRDSLLGAIDELPSNTSVGVVFYPDQPNQGSTCFDNQADVAIARLDASGSGQRKQVENAFARQSPEGGTPTHDAYRYAYTELADADVVGARFAVVITDGNPTYSLGCKGTGLVSDPVDPTPLIAEAQRAKARGVSTFVIGSPGSEGARESLSRMAEAGGTARANCSHTGPNYCHFDMTQSRNFATDLKEALGTIAGLTLSCTYDIPTPPTGQTLDPERVNVLFTPRGGEDEVIGKSGAGACEEGWQYSKDGKQVLLCGSTCDRVKGSEGNLSLVFGCATQVH
jgi:hypothetical protein